MLDPGRLDRLRGQVARIETQTERIPDRTLSLGIAPLDAALGGGLALGTVHEIAPTAPMHLGAATGFGVALVRLAGQPNIDQRERAEKIQYKVAKTQNKAIAHKSLPALWIQQDYATHEAGHPYGIGLALAGLPMSRLFLLRLRQTRDVLWATEEALKSGALSAVLTEFARDDVGLDLTASRRLSLAAAQSGALALLLRHHASAHPSAMATRWEVAAAPGARDAFGGLGTTTFSLSLLKNRRGPTDRWLVSWDQHECIFTAALSLGVAEKARDRPDRAPLMRAG